MDENAPPLRVHNRTVAITIRIRLRRKDLGSQPGRERPSRDARGVRNRAREGGSLTPRLHRHLSLAATRAAQNAAHFTHDDMAPMLADRMRYDVALKSEYVSGARSCKEDSSTKRGDNRV